MLACFVLLPQVAGSANRDTTHFASHRLRSVHSAAAATIGKIAFASDRDGNLEIYVMDADGGSQTRLTEDPAEDFSPAWSPDGKRLAFVSTRDGNAEIYVMNADGTGQTRLTNNSASDLHPAWSPDGSHLAFVSNRDGNDEIYSIDAGGLNSTNLTKNLGDDSSFSFSPNGAMIVFPATARTPNTTFLR
jgi:tol-pal system beta propeller repeat protein TolB